MVHLVIGATEWHPLVDVICCKAVIISYNYNVLSS